MFVWSALWGCDSRAEEPHFDKSAASSEEAQEPAQPKAAAEPASEEPAPSAEGETQAAEPTPKPAGRVRQPTSSDPLDGTFRLEDALEGLEGKGSLKATIDTSEGTIECTLFDDKAPNTVANFVGLARGKRPFWDAEKAAWVKRPLYDGTSFHRVIPGFMIQGGDYLGDGTGEIGYTIDDELHPSLEHDRAGLLCMANKGPDTNGAQFFITDAAAPHLTAMKSYSIFGECTPTETISRIAKVPKSPANPQRPESPVTIRSVRIAR